MTTRLATAYWREAAEAAGHPVYARIVNTSSEAFLLGSVGQPNYAAAKAGIAALTVTTARSCARYGVRANAICPRARTAMTAELMGPAPDGAVDPLAPEHVAPLVVYLASPAAETINGEVFVVHGGVAAVMEPPRVRTVFHAASPDGMWTLESVHAALGPAFGDRAPSVGFLCEDTLTLATETIGFPRPGPPDTRPGALHHLVGEREQDGLELGVGLDRGAAAFAAHPGLPVAAERGVRLELVAVDADRARPDAPWSSAWRGGRPTSNGGGQAVLGVVGERDRFGLVGRTG